MARGRPATPLGAHGAVRFYEVDGGVQARTLLRLYNGKTVQVQGQGSSRAAAVRAMELNCQQRLAGGEDTELSTTSPLGRLVDQWHAQHDVSLRSKEIYRKCIDGHIKPHLGDVRLNELTTRRLQGFLDTLTPGTAQTARAVLSSALGLAVRWDVMPHNPMRETRPPRKQRAPVNALTDEQMDVYRANVAAWIESARKGYSRGDGLLELIDLLRGSGLRIGEALALRWEDVDLENRTVSVSGTVDNKGGRQDFPKTDAGRRVIHVSDCAVGALQRQYSKDYRQQFPNIVFPSARGGFRTVVNVERQLREGRGDLQIVPHDFRKTVATRIEQKFGTLAASRHLGHASTAVTEQSYLAAPEVQPDFTKAFG